MNAIHTTLTTSGNSVAVRLPKELLRMSKLGNEVTLEARDGKIIISRPVNARIGWEAKITTLIAKSGDPTDEFGEASLSEQDGLDQLPWNGPTFEQWQKNNPKTNA